MNVRTLVFVSGMSASLLGACSLNLHQNYDDSKCAGYLGCSAGLKIGPAEGTGVADNKYVGQALHAINQGCGKPVPADTPRTVPGSTSSYTHYTVYGDGATLGTNVPAEVGPRTFWVRVPADYNPNKKYRTVYVGQGCGPYDSANVSTYALFSAAAGGDEEAIYVALDIPRDMINMDCYDNRNGPEAQEWEAFQLFHTFVDDNFCVDNDRVYVAGYSTGGWLSNMWGCYFAGDGLHPGSDPTTQRVFAPEYHIRAQVVTTGGEPPNQPPCNGPVAALWIHDLQDTGNPISGNYSALARVLKMNGCDTSATSPTVTWHAEVPGIGDVCKQYTSCPKETPVVFCTTSGFGHASQDMRAIPAFTTLFKEVEMYPYSAATPDAGVVTPPADASATTPPPATGTDAGSEASAQGTD